MKLGRALKHLVVPDWVARRRFSAADLLEIEKAVKSSEKRHQGELRFVVEASMPLSYLLLRHRSSRRRAEDLFSSLKVWDTERNTGVLIYVQLVSRHIDIVADRGIAAKVGQDEWDAVCRAMESSFKRKEFLTGSLEALERVTALLARHFPAAADGANELPDRPLVL
jgi:uncharacterized membrane protein